jgi:hypothetical protein
MQRAITRVHYTVLLELCVAFKVFFVLGIFATVDFIFLTVDDAARVAEFFTFAIIAISQVRNKAPTMSVDFLKSCVFMGIQKE